MFQNCNSLTKLYLYNFKINNRKAIIDGMFLGCPYLRDFKCYDKAIKSQYSKHNNYY